MSARLRSCLAATALAATLGAALPAAAHDTWFSRLPPTARGETVLALGTGNQFPAYEVAVPLTQLQASGCRGEGVRAAPLRWVADRPNALLLRSARPVPATASLSCWVQLVPIDIEIDDATVDNYLAEINALPAVRQRWAALRARGVRWQETYVKHARIQVTGEGAGEAAPAGSAPAEDAALTAPVDGLGMDLRIEHGAAPLRAGDTLRVQLLRDGQPLAGLPVELRSDPGAHSLWRQTDADGRIALPLPLAAHWLLRGVDLRPSATHPDRWDSRFLTWAFEVLPRR